MLGDRQSHTADINLLKAVTSQKIAWYIAGNSNHRNRIHICCCNTCNKICCSRTRCCNNNAGLTCSSCKTVSSMGSTLLMSCNYMSDSVTIFIKFVIYVYDLTARISEYTVAPLLYKGFYYNLCAG